MTKHIYRGVRLFLGVAAAVTLIACALPAANAQDSRRHDNGGGWSHSNQHQSWSSGNHGGGGWSNQGGNGNWGHGYHQDRTGNHGNMWVETQPSGEHYYHSHPSYYYHPYHGREHRRYYTYGGNEFYINLDTGIRIEL